MSDVKPLTTGQAARYCHVSQATIINWIRRGDLRAYATPGGHYRIQLPDFLDFLKTYKMPVDSTLRTDTQPQVLVVSNSPQTKRLTQALRKNKQFKVFLASSGHEAGAQIVRLEPDAVVLDVMSTSFDWADLCRWLRASKDKKALVVLAVGAPEDVEIAEGAGANGCLSGVTVAERLEAELQTLLELDAMQDSHEDSPYGR